MPRSLVTSLVLLSVVLGGCGTVRNILGVPSPGDPSVAIRAAEARWLLVKNPRFGNVPSEPEYIWVEEDKRPWTTQWGIPQRAAMAPPEVVARYGPPPGGGKVSPRQGMPYQAGADAPRPVSAPGTAAPATAAATGTAAPVSDGPKRGFVVWADTSRIVIDLTTQDGLRPGSIVSLRRDRIPIIHPITGERLGELDEEVATARVTETREKFSVAEIQTVAPGAQVQVRDRVVPK
ncbi:MAG: hypothetical protein HYU51_07660 [Candidatus Rokubacteria bacterium]|nr:hypothetical protein [Candidatus Rokubacteria bacterium]